MEELGNPGKFPPQIPTEFHRVLSDTVFQVLADNPEEEFNAWGVAEKLGSENIKAISKALIRMASYGKGGRPVKKTMRGFFQYSEEKKEPLFDQIRQSGSFGIENLVFIKKELISGKMGGIPPQIPTIPKGEFAPDSHHMNLMVGNSHQVHTTENAGGSTFRRGFPKQIRTGQRILWEIFSNGTEKITFSANGSGPFPLVMILYLLEELKEMGFGPGWWQERQELLVDNKHITSMEMVTLQVAEKQFLKFYQHGNSARLEVADRRQVPYEEALLMLVDANDRAHGRQALKRVTGIETVVEEVIGEQKRQSSRITNIHKKLKKIEGHQERFHL